MKKVIQFIQEVVKEFKNITWPKKETLFELTTVVISISIIISLILGGLDFIFTNSLSLLTSLKTTTPKAQPTEAIPTSTFVITTIAPTATPKTNK